VRETLEEIEQKLDRAALAARTSRERAVADEIVRDMEVAVRAAEEVMAI
jgi:hypothetical protein